VEWLKVKALSSSPSTAKRKKKMCEKEGLLLGLLANISVKCGKSNS
jgi:hypothetical protein